MNTNAYDVSRIFWTIFKGGSLSMRVQEYHLTQHTLEFNEQFFDDMHLLKPSILSLDHIQMVGL